MSAAEAAKQAARMEDPIEHGIGLLGMLAGMLLGAIVGAIIVAATIATGGAALAIGIAVVGAVGITAGTGLAGGQLARGLARANFIPSGIKTGSINPICSPDVITGFKPSARAVLDTGKCNGLYSFAHFPLPPGPLPPIAEGSSTVLINHMPAPRQGDKLVCGADIQYGEPTVIIGGETVRLLEVDDPEARLEKILSYVAIGAAVAGLLLLTGGVAAGAICGTVLLQTLGGAAVMLGVNWGLGEVGDAIGPGWRDILQGGFGVAGTLASGVQGLRMFGGRPFISEPVDAVTGEVCMQQTDVLLPGALPLTLVRTYVSGMGHGSSFGPKWASTWGQWIEVAGGKAFYFTDDGRNIDFDLPRGDEEAKNRYVNKIRLRRTPAGFAVRDAANRTLLFEHESGPRWVLSAITDLNGNRIDFLYSEDGGLIAVSHSGGYRLRVESSGSLIRRILLVTDSGDLEELARYDYEARGHLAGVVKNKSQSMRFQYDDSGRMLEWRDSRGTWFAYRYDSQGRCVEGRGPDGLYNSKFRYHDGARATYYTDSLGNTTTFVYNELLQVVEKIDARGGITRTKWDIRSNKLEEENPNGGVNEFEYDGDGNLVRCTNPLGQTIEVTYNEFGQPVALVDPAGKVWFRRFDERGNLIEAGEAGGRSFTYERDDRGNLTRFKHPAGKSREFGSDSRGLQIWETDWDNHRSTYLRDNRGRIVERTDALGNRFRYEFNDAGRLALTTLPTGAKKSWQYDSEGNVTGHIDAAGRRFRLVYGPFDLLQEEWKPGGGCVRYHYNTEGRLVTVENELGEQYSYRYNETGQVVSERDFAGREIRLERDAIGNCVKTVNGLGQGTLLLRDALGRVHKKVLAEGRESHFAYDDYGNLISATNEALEVSFERDEYGRVVREVQGDLAIESAYDERGLRINRKTSTGQESLWTYDSNGLPSGLRIGGEALEFWRDARGREIGRRLGQDLVVHHEYDALDRMVRQWASLQHRLDSREKSLANAITQREFKYDDGGNPIEVRDGRWGTTRYSYDANGRVRRVDQGSGGFEEYDYDLAGNVASALWSKPTQPGQPEQQIGPDSHAGRREYEAGGRLKLAGKNRYEFDSDGRTVAKTVGGQDRWQYDWSSDGRLLSVRNPAGQRWEYRYDALGRRISKHGPDESTRFVWDGVVVAEELRGNGEAVVWEYEPGTFRPLLKQESGRVYALLNDQIGLPREMITGGGEIVWNGRTRLWGEQDEVAVSQTDCQIRFPGQWHDPESGLAYNGERYYDPETGNYLSADPMRLAGGIRPYGYVHNPLAWIDPWGLAGCVPKEPVVIGENMQGRVNPYAERIGGTTIDEWLGGRPWSQELNDEFIGAMKAEGREFVDIGPDFDRRLQNNLDPANGRPPSSVYGGERQQLQGYDNYTPVYTRDGKYQGGVPGFDP